MVYIGWIYIDSANQSARLFSYRPEVDAAICISISPCYSNYPWYEHEYSGISLTRLCNWSCIRFHTNMNNE